MSLLPNENCHFSAVSSESGASAVSPGPVDTEMFRSAGYDENAKNFLISRTPLGRIGTPSDIADVVAFLASPDARWVTGQVLDTTGGLAP